MLHTSFVAVPAFNRVEPVNTSGPGSTSIVNGHTFLISLFLLQTIAQVFAPILCAYSNPPIT